MQEKVMKTLYDVEVLLVHLSLLQICLECNGRGGGMQESSSIQLPVGN